MSKPGGITGVLKTYKVGTEVGRWRVLECVKELMYGTKRVFRCECAKDLGGCGTVKLVIGATMAKGTSTSCGCFQRECVAAVARVHGASGTKAYAVWQSLKKRCASKRPTDWATYGGRGIRVCDLWASGFENFIGDIGPMPSDRHTVRRSDTNASYTCGHCDDCQRRGLPRNGAWVDRETVVRVRTEPDPSPKQARRITPQFKYKKINRRPDQTSVVTVEPVTPKVVSTKQPRPPREKRARGARVFVFDGAVPDNATLVNGRSKPRPSRIQPGYVCGRWRVLYRTEDQPGPRRRMLFACECAIDLGGCGSTKVVLGESLLRRLSFSCGCIRSQVSKQVHLKHGATIGHAPTVEYETWGGMIDRCENEKSPNFIHYGGRGIAVCDRWRHDFEAFEVDMGLRPSPEHSIDRIDNDGNYEPGNCRWATRKQQSRNQRRTVRVVYDGVSRPLIDVAEEVGMKYELLRSRVQSGVPLETALLRDLPIRVPIRQRHPSLRVNLLPY